MNPEVREAFAALDPGQLVQYHKYWKGIAPRNDREVFQRFLFAFCSVHTTWKSNVSGYEAIKDFTPMEWSIHDLRAALIRGRCGMFNNRTTWIYSFGLKYWMDPSTYQKDGKEPLGFLRNRLLGSIKGLGVAKLTFALEMVYPVDPQLDIACLDIHMLRLYNAPELNGNGSGPSLSKYQQFESDWTGRSAGIGISPYITRMAYWDKVQGQQDSRYWSHVFEDKHDQSAKDQGTDRLVDNRISGETGHTADALRYAPEPHAEGRDQVSEGAN